MVKISVRDLVSGADTVEEGRIIATALTAARGEHDLVALSFSGIGSASSSFVTASLIPALRELGFDGFKRRVRIVESSWQIADVIKRRVALEHVVA
jgi:hypothetical protein